jgi:hypothetical protein
MRGRLERLSNDTPVLRAMASDPLSPLTFVAYEIEGRLHCAGRVIGAVAAAAHPGAGMIG